MIASLLLISTTLRAHPHNWIDVFTEWHFNPQGQINRVTMRWWFDDYYSVLLADEAAANPQGLSLVLERLLRNVKPHHYFLQLEYQGMKVALGPPERTSIRIHEHRIEIELSLSIRTPLDPTQSDIIYQVAEPTYYFEMLHAEESSAIRFKDAPYDCRYSLDPATPDATLIAYAASLGIHEQGSPGLGHQFAETVTIRCE